MLYLGRKRIASGGGTTTVTAHQFTNNVSDIKPDGASASLGVLDTIVRADHVHPITIATLNSLGVVKPNKAMGTSIDANGNLSVETANASEISSRSSQSKVIYTGNLNNSVKAALTDANHITMTAAEQATAQTMLNAQPLASYPTAESIDFTQFGENPTLEDFMAYFKANYPKTFKCSIGNAADNKLKELIGTPPNVGNYTNCIIIPVVYNTGKSGTLYKVIATDEYLSYLGNMATGYLYTVDNNAVSPSTEKTIWVGWENASKTTQEKIEDYAQPFVNTDSAIDITFWQDTNINDYLDKFVANYPKSYRCNIGTSSNCNFKDYVVGTPFTSNRSYVICWIVPTTLHNHDFKNATVYTLYAQASLDSQLAVGYICSYRDASNQTRELQYYFTGWQYPKNGEVEHLVTIYDKDSTDSSINWSYTSGIENGTTVSSKDFTPYKALRVTFATYRGNFIYYVDLTKKDLGDYSYKGAVSYTYYDSSLGVLVLFSNTNVNSDKNSINFESGFIKLSDNTTTNTYKVYKIEGVLK